MEEKGQDKEKEKEGEGDDKSTTTTTQRKQNRKRQIDDAVNAYLVHTSNPPPPPAAELIFMAHLAACPSYLPPEKHAVVMAALENQLRYMFRGGEFTKTQLGIVMGTRFLPYIADRIRTKAAAMALASAGGAGGGLVDEGAVASAAASGTISLELNYLTKRMADRNTAVSLNKSYNPLRLRSYSSKMKTVLDARIHQSHDFGRLGGVKQVFESYNTFYLGSTTLTAKPRKYLREDLLEPVARAYFNGGAPSSFFDFDEDKERRYGEYLQFYDRYPEAAEAAARNPFTNQPSCVPPGSGGVPMDTGLVF